MLQPRTVGDQALANKMLELAEPTAPYVFGDAGASCRRGPCKEGKMTCGSPLPRIKRPISTIDRKVTASVVNNCRGLSFKYYLQLRFFRVYFFSFGRHNLLNN